MFIELLKKRVFFSVLLVLMIGNSYGQGTCDVNSYSSDPATFADLVNYDLQEYSLGTSTWDGTDYIAVGDLSITGIAWIANGWCIPNMDSNYPGCGGSNLYIASAIDMTILPQTPINRIGFDYGSQSNSITFEVTLSDGSVIVLSDYNSDYTPATGFFGYCTGNTDLTITSIHLSGADGGIDNLRYGTVGGNDCSIDNLGQKIIDFNLHQGITQSLLAQLGAATNAINRGNTEAAISILGAMVNHIEAQRGKKIPTDVADELLQCLENIINALS